MTINTLLKDIKDALAGTAISTMSSAISSAFNSSLSFLKVAEQSPLDQQVIDMKLLDAVTATGASTSTNVLDKGRLSFVVNASSVTTGGVFTFQVSADNTNWATVSTFINGDTTGSATQTISANGNYLFTVDSKVAVKYIRANLTSRTDGTYTCYLFGGAI